jgi:hypothetical protein
MRLMDHFAGWLWRAWQDAVTRDLRRQYDFSPEQSAAIAELNRQTTEIWDAARVRKVGKVALSKISTWTLESELAARPKSPPPPPAPPDWMDPNVDIRHGRRRDQRG